MLLVDHHRAEVLELDALLDQRVGADGQVDRTLGQPGLHLGPLLPGDPVGQQGHPQRPVAEDRPRVGHGQVAEQLGDARVVLLGQDLGGRHQRALVPALDGIEQRRHGHDRLAAAHVALQQAVHRVRAGQVALDLGDGPLLRPRQGEGQPLVEPSHQLAADLVADAEGVALEGPLAQHQHQLDAQQLVEGQPAPGLLLLADRLREVDAVQRGGPVDETEP